MWLRSEIELISKTLNFASLDQILTSEEIENIPPAWLPNLRSRILEPKHSRPVIQIINLKFPILLSFLEQNH